MPPYQSKEFYANLFHLLLGRELSDEDYSLHFSALDIRSYISSLLDCPEFIEKNIYPAFNQPPIPIVDREKLISLYTENSFSADNIPAVALSVEGFQPLISCRSPRQHQRVFPIAHTQAIHVNNQGTALQRINSQLLRQALQASRGAVELLNARDTMAALLLRSPGLLNSDLHQYTSVSLELFLLPTAQSFRRYSLYSSLFTSLVGRSLTRDDYDMHFSRVSTTEFIALLLKSPECLAKTIFEILPSCTCARIYSPQQLAVQLPAALDDGAYILLSIDSGKSLIIAIKLRLTSEIVEKTTESETLDPSDPRFLSDAITAALIRFNSFTNEDLLSVVDNFAISTVVDVETFVSLQSGYLLPELVGVFSPASSCTVSLMSAGQLTGFVNEIDSISSPANLVLAI